MFGNYTKPKGQRSNLHYVYSLGRRHPPIKERCRKSINFLNIMTLLFERFKLSIALYALNLTSVQIGEITLIPDEKYHSPYLEVWRKFISRRYRTSNDLIRTSAFNNLISIESSSDFKYFLKVVLIHLSDLPPLTNLYDSDTFDRVEHWLLVKSHAEMLYYSFRSYYQGLDNPHENIPSDLKYLIDLERDSYKSLYDLIHDGWVYIKSAVQNDKLDNFGLFETPGKVFLQILTDEIMYQLFLAYPEDEINGGNDYIAFSPRQHNKREDEIKKLYRLKASGILSKPEANKLRRLEKQQSKLNNWGRNLRLLCVSICSKASKKTTTHRKYVEYLRIEEELNAHTKKLSRKSRGFAWDKGILKRGCQQGGTYRNNFA
jgi:hypothetical protein